MTQTNLKNNPNSSLLKESRLAKSLSLEVVHEATKIPMDALRAIEDGYSTRILTPFYYRGFIKIYAEFLGLNVQDVLKEYNVQASFAKTVVKKSHLPPVNVPASAPKIPQGPSIVDTLLDFWKKFWTAKTRKNLLRVIGVLIALFVLVKFVGCVANFVQSRPKSHKVNVVANKQASKKSQNKSEEVKNEAKNSTEGQQDSDQQNIPAKNSNDNMFSSLNHKVTLAVHANKDSWIQVKTDGKVAFQMTMKKGTMENWEAKNDIELTGKNLGDLNLEVNGKDVDSIGSFNRRSKKVVITKDGLTVKK